MKIESKSVKELVKMYTSGRIDVSMSWQRELVSSWKKQERIDLLCDSMLKGFSIQAVHLIELASGAFELLDGKQRLTVIANVIADIYPVSLDGGEAIYFSQWDEADKVKFLAYVIPVIVLDLENSEKKDSIRTSRRGVAFERPRKT